MPSFCAKADVSLALQSRALCQRRLPSCPVFRKVMPSVRVDVKDIHVPLDDILKAELGSAMRAVSNS